MNIRDLSESDIELKVNELGELTFEQRIESIKEIISCADEDGSTLSKLAMLCYKFDEELLEIHKKDCEKE